MEARQPWSFSAAGKVASRIFGEREEEEDGGFLQGRI